MKKVALFLVVLLAGIVASGSTGCGQARFTIREGTLVVGAELDVPWLMEKGAAYEGFGVEVLERVADELDLEIELVPTTIGTRLEDMNGDRYDVLGAPVVITAERKAQMDITVPVAETDFKLVVYGDSAPGSREELAGAVVGAVEGSRALKLARAMPGISDVRVFPHDDEVYEALRDGTVDVILSPSVEFAWRTRDGDGFVSIGEIGEPTEWGFGVRKGNTELLTRLNRVLDGMKGDGSLLELQEKWLGE